MVTYTQEEMDKAIESEIGTAQEIAKTHWKCKACNMIISDDNASKKTCFRCGHDMARMHPDDVAKIY